MPRLTITTIIIIIISADVTRIKVVYENFGLLIHIHNFNTFVTLKPPGENGTRSN